MPTNEERREVAARLRRFKSDDVSSYSEYLEKLDEIIGINGCEETGDRLADLIEPEPERTCHIVAWFEARTRSEIGRELMELSCGHLVERHSKFCHECGAKVVE